MIKPNIKLSITQAELDLIREALIEKYSFMLDTLAIAEAASTRENGADPYEPAPLAKNPVKKRGRPAGSRNKK